MTNTERASRTFELIVYDLDTESNTRSLWDSKEAAESAMPHIAERFLLRSLRWVECQPPSSNPFRYEAQTDSGQTFSAGIAEWHVYSSLDEYMKDEGG